MEQCNNDDQVDATHDRSDPQPVAVTPAGMLVTKTTSADLTTYLHSSPPRQSSVSATSDVITCTETAVLINDVIGNKTTDVYADDVTDNESAVVACCDVTDNDVTTDDDTVVGGGGAYQVLLQTSLTISNLDTTLSQQPPREVYKMAATSTSAPSVGEMLNPKELVHATAVEEGLVDETDDVFVKDDDHSVSEEKEKHPVPVSPALLMAGDSLPALEEPSPDDRHAGLQQAAKEHLDSLQQEYEVKKAANQARRRRLIFLMVFLLCMGGVVQGILVNGLINVVIGTLEKRYGLQSTDSGLIASCYDIASFICLLPVSYLGGRGTGSKPVWISGGIFLMGIGSLLFSLPYFLQEGPRHISEGGSSGVSFCRQPIICTDEQQQYGSGNHLKYVFMAANLMHGAGASPLYTLGVTYIDENVGAKDSAFYLGMFYTMAILGPALGYSMGGHFLNLHVDFLSFDVDSSPRGQDWTGAWWLGFVFCGFASLLLAFFIFFLPPSLPGIEEPTDDQVCRSRLPSRGSSFRRASYKARPLNQRGGGGGKYSESDSESSEEEDIDLTGAGGGPLPVGEELVNALTLIFTNPTFVFLSLAGSAEGFLMQGLATFLPKLMQNQFSLSESEAALNVGVVSVVAGAGGTLLGGAICKKFRLKVPGLLKLVSVTQFVAILTAIGLLANCPVDRNLRGSPIDRGAGLRMTGGQQHDIVEANQCARRDCGCELASDYNPVCVEGEQYYNPCWAGCTAENRTSGHYINCSCAFSRPTPMQISAPLLNQNGGSGENELEYGGGENGYAATSDNDGSTSAQPPPLAAATGADIGSGEEIGPVGEPGLCKEWNTNRRRNIFVSCLMLSVFITSFFFTMLITFMANMPALTATLRCVHPSVRSLALGVQWLLIRGLGTIPGPVAFGRMLDSNCNQWKVGCSGVQNCLNYDNDRVSHIILQLTALCKGLTIFAFLIAMSMYTHGSPGSRQDGAAVSQNSQQQLDSNIILPTTELKTPEKSTELK